MNESTKRTLRLYEDFGDEPDWIKNVPEGYLLTKSVNRFPAIGLSEAKGAATNRFMRDRGVKSGYIRNMPRAEEWYDKNTNTAYALTDTTKPTIVGLDQERLPGDRMVTISGADLSEEISPELQEMMDRRHRPDAASTNPTRPSALIRERRVSEDPLTDAISADGDDAIDMAGLEPPTVTRQAPAPTRESEQVQTSASVTQPDTVRNVRNNNPGNLRTGDVETAQRYYGEDAVTGVDKGGFAQFSSPEAGISALQQQVRVDTNRGMNLGEFLNKYTPESDDPSGNKAAKTNIPKLVNANLDTPLADIDPTELTLAITRQEGGNEALQAFEPGIRRSAPTLADIERGAANAEKMARESEVETRFGQGSTLAPQDRTVSRDSAMSGMPTQGTTAQQDDELTKRLVGDNIDENDDYGSLPTQSRRGRAASRDAELQRRANPPIGEEPAFRGTTRGGQVIEGSKPGILESISQAAGFEYTPKRGRVGRGRNEALIYGGQQNAESAPSEQPAFMQQGRDVDIIGMDEAARTAERPRGLPTLERDITDPDMTDDTVTADAQKVELDLEGMAPPQQTLLQRIGNALKDNPELAASGVQLLGGLLSNAAQNRAQRKADRATDQRVARANLISAITGGRARPTVERAQADTGGFMSLDTLGKALQGGGAAVKGELSRRVEEAERERKAGLDERAADLDERAAELAENRLELTEIADRNTENYRNRMAQIKEDELALRRDIFKAENNKQPVGEQLSDGKILEFSSRIQAVAKTDELTDFLKDANLSFLEKGQFSFKNVPQLLFGGNAAEAEARRQNLIQAMAESYGGKLSNQDVERIDKQLFTQRDNLKTSLQVAKVFRSTLVGSLERDLRLLEEGGFNVGYIQNDLYETDEGQSESDADRLGSMLSDNPLDRISRQ